MTVSVIEVWEYIDKPLAQRINEVIIENNISRDRLIDIKYASADFPRESKIITSALIIFDKED